MTGLSVEEGSEAATAQPTPTPPTISLEEHGDHLVQVKIDGQFETMRLRDALRGVAHQRKVTEATQNLEKYQRFFAELERNPEEIIRSLGERFGVTPTNPEVTDVEETQANPEVAALQQQLNELTGMLQTQQQQHAYDTQVAQINRELDELTAQYGDAVDRQEVLAYATNNEIPNVRLAYQAMAFEKSQNGVATPEAPKATEVAAVLDSIAPGSPTATPPPPVPAEQPAKSPMDAIKRAMETLPEDSPFRAVRV